MPDNRLKAFVNTIKNTDSDEVILDAVKSEYSAEIGSAVNLGKDILDKAKNKFHDLKKDSKQLDNPEEQTTPTFQREQFGNQLQKTERDAVSTVMRPDVPEYNKKSKDSSGSGSLDGDAAGVSEAGTWVGAALSGGVSSPPARDEIIQMPSASTTITASAMRANLSLLFIRIPRLEKGRQSVYHKPRGFATCTGARGQLAIAKPAGP